MNGIQLQKLLPPEGHLEKYRFPLEVAVETHVSTYARLGREQSRGDFSRCPEFGIDASAVHESLHRTWRQLDPQSWSAGMKWIAAQVSVGGWPRALGIRIVAADSGMAWGVAPLEMDWLGL